MLSYIGIFLLGSTLGFFTCAFFVGANKSRWEEAQWENILIKTKKGDNSDD